MTLPRGWASATIADVTAINPKHPVDADRGQSVSFVPMPAVDEHLGAIVDRIDKTLDEIWTGYTHFADGDVIFAKITPCMENGKAAVASGLTNGLACGSTEFYVFRPEGGVDAHYLWRFLRQESFRVEAENHMTGAVGQRRVPRSYLESHGLPLPPSSEQRRIAAKLDALTARIARARADLDRVPLLAEKLRQSVVKDAFSGRLTEEFRRNSPLKAQCDEGLEELFAQKTGSKRKKPAVAIDWRPELVIPDEWRWVSVDRVIAAAQYGSSSKTNDNSDGVPVLRMGNIQSGELDFSNLKYLPSGHYEFPALLLSEGDVLFNRTNSFELVGKSAVFRGASKPMSFASYLIRLQCSGILPDLLVRYLNSPIGRSWIESVASQQVGQANVNGTKLRSLGIPLPPPGEQVEMKRQIDLAFARAGRLEAEATRARKLVDRLESAILVKAFRGELVPQDPNDEPASVLLERIRAERAAGPKAKRGRRAAS